MCEICSKVLIKPPKRRQYPLGNYMFKVNNRNTRTRCEIYSKLTTKIPERRHWRHSYTKFITLEIKCRFTFDEPDLY